jgi:hypothetical protein
MKDWSDYVALFTMPIWLPILIAGAVIGVSLAVIFEPKKDTK